MPSKFISNSVLREVLLKATEEEKLSLTKLLDDTQKHAFSYEKIQEEICKCGGHDVTNVFRGQGTGYLDILDDVAKKIKIKGLTSYYGETEKKLSVFEFDEIASLKKSKIEATKMGIEYAEKTEEKIILKLLEITYEKMSPEEKLKFDTQINEVAKKFDANPTKRLVGPAGLMVLGNLGGFATYTLLTTTMSTISMGTLGFGAYTTATSLLSVVLGPVGWVGLGAAALFAYGKPKYNKLIRIVATVGVIRQRTNYEKKES